jgi:hypothetical protein
MAVTGDLHWLIHQGHVIEFANGRLETAKRPKPRPIAPPAPRVSPQPAAPDAAAPDATAPAGAVPAEPRAPGQELHSEAAVPAQESDASKEKPLEPGSETPLEPRAETSESESPRGEVELVKEVPTTEGTAEQATSPVPDEPGVTESEPAKGA